MPRTPSEPGAQLWRIEPLGPHHDRAAFSCGNDSLDRYLREQASQDARRSAAAPFVLVSTTEPNTVAGYYTLSSHSIDLGEVPAHVARKLPRYPLVPATLLGRLAVYRRYKGQGLGERLLMDALRRALTQSAQIAAASVTVDAIDDPAACFYRHFGFIPFPDRPDRLFLLMKTIAALFGTL
jgi:GNAT superfamily N-acetyltransferase